MRRSLQEIIELVVFGLIALLLGTGLIWLVGWILGLTGLLLKFVAGLIWSLLRFIIPIAVGAAVVYALVRLIQNQSRGKPPPAATPTAAPTPVQQPPSPPPHEELSESEETEGDAGSGDGDDKKN